ncbi:MAG TPA: transcriptional repressor [Herpetosiphonaceae bacterium]|nr:transcriptional repressor [Herpetosiphonaceae bacterium]
MANEAQTGLRMTGNRQIVLEVLRNTTAHPTAQQVFLWAREQQPGIGFATVYRTLDFLVTHGMAQEVFRDKDGAAHYDGNVTRHDHAICNRCGRIEDVSAPLHALAYAIIERAAGFRIGSHATAFTGLCADCVAQEEDD